MGSNEQDVISFEEMAERRRAQKRVDLRDQFAMAALTGALSNPNTLYSNPGHAAQWAYSYADAMLKVRGEA